MEECGDSPFALNLRIPGWAKSATVTVDGKAIGQDVRPGEYVEIRRAWQAGNDVRLHLAMPSQLIEAHPFIEENRNHVAVKRGPIVYCLESNDLPEGTRLAEVSIPRDLELTPQYESQFLQGVTVLKGMARVAGTGDWTGKLYRELGDRDSNPVPVKFIPYYAWSNRGRSEMSVWLPLD